MQPSGHVESFPTHMSGMSSPAPVPLLRPPVPGGRAQRAPPRLGLSIPPSPHARPVNGNNEGSTLARPAPPQLRLATPMGSSHTPYEGRPQPKGLPPLQIGTGLSAGGSSDASAHSRSGSFGEVQANGSASSYQAALGFPSLQRTHNGSDPISAISQQGSEGAPAMERENSSHPLPDLDKLAAEKGAPLDVEDLDDAGWKAASAKGIVQEMGSLGEGAGGAVTKCVLSGGKTIFALKVGHTTVLVLAPANTVQDHHNESGPRRQEADCARAVL
jgi:mitogen-activated protein kinase kinase